MQLRHEVLEDAHVRLEPLTEAHRELLRPLAQDLSMWETTTMRADGDHFDPWYAGILESQARGSLHAYAVWSKRWEAWAGHTAYVSVVADHARAEIGSTWYASAFHGTDVNPACKRLLFGRAFGSGAVRVELKAHHLNQRSQRAMEKLGAVREGVLRSHMGTWKGPRRDTVYYSVLSDEWPLVLARLDERLGDSLAAL